MNLADLCADLRNYFEKSKYFGKFSIQDGVIDLSDLEYDDSIQDGQYFRIVGSVFNDGVYQYPAAGLIDESFDGAVWPMAVPPAALSLLDDINAWLSDPKVVEAMSRPYQSESFGGYSYTKASGSGSAGGNALTWQSQFASRLNRWRKIR